MRGRKIKEKILKFDVLEKMPVQSDRTVNLFTSTKQEKSIVLGCII